MANKKVLFSIVEEIKQKKYNVDELIGCLRLKEFWLAILPVKEKYVEIRAPNVVYSKVSDDFFGMGLGPSTSKMEIEGEFIIEDRGSDDKGRFLDFHVRNCNIASESEGRLRVRPASSGVKIGVYMYTLKLKTDIMGLGQQAAEMILRKKIREMLKNIENY